MIDWALREIVDKIYIIIFVQYVTERVLGPWKQQIHSFPVNDITIYFDCFILILLCGPYIDIIRLGRCDPATGLRLFIIYLFISAGLLSKIQELSFDSKKKMTLYL